MLSSFNDVDVKDHTIDGTTLKKYVVKCFVLVFKELFVFFGKYKIVIGWRR